MANFDSVGAGLARGITRGMQIRQFRQQREDAQQEAEQARIVDLVTNSKKEALSMFETAAEQAGRAAAAAGPEDPRAMSIAQHAKNMLEVHAGVLEEYFPGEGVGQQFIERHLPLLQTTIDAAVLEAEADVARGTSFFAEVGGENVRVTQVPRDDGGIDFFVGDRQVPAEEIRPTVQKTQDTTGEFQIPGLTAAQSGNEVMELRKLAAAGNAYAELANRVSQDISDRPEKVGTVGDVIRGFSSLTAQAEGLMNVMNLDYRWENSDGSEATLDDFNFGPLASEAAAVKRTLLDLVFLDLASKGQTGRAVSDRDLQIFMDNTGIASGDPKQVIAGLKRGVENNKALLRENVLARSGGAFTLEDLTPSGSVEFQSPVGADIMRDADAAVTAAINSGDLERAEALLDAMSDQDADRIRELLNAAGNTQ